MISISFFIVFVLSSSSSSSIEPAPTQQQQPPPPPPPPANWFDGMDVDEGLRVDVYNAKSRKLRYAVESSSSRTIDGDDFERRFLDVKNASDAAYSLLMAPFPLKLFLKNYWETKPLLLHRPPPNNKMRFFDLLNVRTLRDVVRFGVSTKKDDANDEMTLNDDWRLSRRVFNNDDQRHWSSGRVDVTTDDISSSLQRGYSLVVNRLHERSTVLNTFCDSLEKFFGFQCGVNSYLSPLNSHGFALHHDTQEAFIVQVSGRKAWRICGAWPMQTIARWHERKPPSDDIASPCSIVILHPGDTLYLPRGVLHETTTTHIKSHDDSFHLTFGLEAAFLTTSDCLHYVGDEFSTDAADKAMFAILLKLATNEVRDLRRSVSKQIDDNVDEKLSNSLLTFVTYSTESQRELQLNELTTMLPIDDRVRDLTLFDATSFQTTRDRVLQWLKSNCNNNVESTTKTTTTLSNQCSTLLKQASEKCFANANELMAKQHERHQHNLRRTKQKQERIQIRTNADSKFVSTSTNREIRDKTTSKQNVAASNSKTTTKTTDDKEKRVETKPNKEEL